MPHRHMMSFASPVTPISAFRKEHHMPMSVNCNPTDTVYGILPTTPKRPLKKWLFV